MQQVGVRLGLAEIRSLDPRRLPAVRPAPNRALVSMGHVWVLHRPLIVRLMAFVIAAGAIAGAYQAREQIGAGAATLGQVLQGQFAEAGFAISEIRISGQTLTSESEIMLALGLNPLISTVNFDAAAARERIAELPAIKSVTVRKIYPGQVVVEVTEREPIARWRVDGVTFLIDSEGLQIADAAPQDVALPLIIGEGAADDAVPIMRALNQHKSLHEGLAAVSRIADRRWDLIYESGLRVQLPEAGVAQALDRLEMYQRDYQLMDRDITLIDLRVDSAVAVRPTLREEDEE